MGLRDDSKDDTENRLIEALSLLQKLSRTRADPIKSVYEDANNATQEI